MWFIDVEVFGGGVSVNRVAIDLPIQFSEDFYMSIQQSTMTAVEGFIVALQLVSSAITN